MNPEERIPKHAGQTMACRECGTSWDSAKAKTCPLCHGSNQGALKVLDEKYAELSDQRRVLVTALDTITLLRDRLRH